MLGKSSSVLEADETRAILPRGVFPTSFDICKSAKLVQYFNESFPVVPSTHVSGLFGKQAQDIVHSVSPALEKGQHLQVRALPLKHTSKLNALCVEISIKNKTKKRIIGTRLAGALGRTPIFES